MVAFPGDILDFGNSVRFITSLAWLVMSLCGQPPQAPIVATWKLFSKSNVYYLRDKSHYVNTLQYCYSIVHDPNFPSTERVHIAQQERTPDESNSCLSFHDWIQNESTIKPHLVFKFIIIWQRLITNRMTRFAPQKSALITVFPCRLACCFLFQKSTGQRWWETGDRMDSN